MNALSVVPTTTTTIAVRHVVGTSNVEIITAVGVVATAAFTWAAWRIGVKVYRLAQALASVEGSMLATPVRSTFRASRSDVMRIPTEWDRVAARYVLVRLKNLATKAQTASGLGEIRVGSSRWRLTPMDHHRKDSITIGGEVADIAAVLLRGPFASRTESVWIDASWELGNAEPVRFKGKLRLFPITDTGP